MNEPTAKTRNLSFDLLKGLSILIVVFYHNMRLNPDSLIDNLWMLAANAAVPCFFLVSGALFFSRPFDLRRHVIRLIRLYLVLTGWRAIYACFYGLYLHGGLGGSLRAFLSYLFVFKSIDTIPTGPFWFTEAMLAVLAAAPFLRVCREKSRSLTLYLMAILFLFNQLLNDGQFLITLLSQWAGRSVWDITTFGQINPFSFSYSNYMLYFLLGAELYERKDRFAAKPSAIMAAAGLAGLLLIRYLQTGTFLWQNTHIVSGYYWISTMLLSGGIFLLAVRLPAGSHPVLRLFSNTVGTSSMGIFYMHTALITILTPSFFVLLDPWNGWIVNLAESILMVAIACAVVWLMRKIPLVRALV